MIVRCAVSQRRKSWSSIISLKNWTMNLLIDKRCRKKSGKHRHKVLRGKNKLKKSQLLCQIWTYGLCRHQEKVPLRWSKLRYKRGEELKWKNIKRQWQLSGQSLEKKKRRLVLRYQSMMQTQITQLKYMLLWHEIDKKIMALGWLLLAQTNILIWITNGVNTLEAAPSQCRTRIYRLLVNLTERNQDSSNSFSRSTNDPKNWLLQWIGQWEVEQIWVDQT